MPPAVWFPYFHAEGFQFQAFQLRHLVRLRRSTDQPPVVRHPRVVPPSDQLVCFSLLGFCFRHLRIQLHQERLADHHGVRLHAYLLLSRHPRLQPRQGHATTAAPAPGSGAPGRNVTTTGGGECWKDHEKQQWI